MLLRRHDAAAADTHALSGLFGADVVTGGAGLPVTERSERRRAQKPAAYPRPASQPAPPRPSMSAGTQMPAANAAGPAARAWASWAICRALSA